MSPTRIRVGVETSRLKSFASALDWPGWSRPGKTPEAAVEALLSYAPRYATVAARAGLELATDSLDADIVEQLDGDATTAFGAPSITFEADRAPTDAAEAKRIAALVQAAWTTFDETAATAPADLRKGPRGGGRDTAKMVEHVVGAEQAYATRLGVRVRMPDPGDAGAVAALRAAILAPLNQPSDGSPIDRWTQRYAARRIAWHAIDHAWEIEDRST
ncbi:MAG: hypothetical protein QOI92_2522 [Chloroflexota bacterium]|nr:hypothetical protein [Chloroflexota bacterium]